MRVGVLAALLALAACGGEQSSDGGASGTSAGTEMAGAAPVAAAAAGAGSAAVPSGGAAPPPAGSPGLPGRTRELVNPEPLAVVLLNYDLTGTEPPFARWVESDSRVTTARPIDKPAQRELVRAELEAALAAVKGVGALRLTMAAELSDYDPSYGEFTIRSLAPSRVVTFDANQQHVELRFANGLDAQVWKLGPDEAQLVRDKLGPFGGATLDVLVRITDVQPGGTIVTEVVEWELRVQNSGERLGRMRVQS
jgi:hypothetical protein